MHIFVTGGAGYIGSATVQMLLEAGHDVTVYDNLSTGYRGAVPAGCEFVYGDLGHYSLLERALKSHRFDAVIHFASFIEAGESMQNPAKYFHNNVANSLNLIDAAVEAGVPRFVLSSTAAIFAGSDEPLHEESTIGPANVYGETKLMIETMLRWFHTVKGLRYAALRYFNACGALPGRGEAHRPETHLIPLTLQVALGQREHIKIFGTDYPTPDGTAIRDYVHVADLASAHLLAVEKLAERETLALNLGTGTGFSVREIIDVAREVTGHPIPAIETPRRPGDAPRLVADPRKAEAELGWVRRHSAIRNVMQTAWAWHDAHPGGYLT